MTVNLVTENATRDQWARSAYSMETRDNGMIHSAEGKANATSLYQDSEGWAIYNSLIVFVWNFSFNILDCV